MFCVYLFFLSLDVLPITEPLNNIAGDDIRFKHIKLVMFNARCSKTAVANPVEYLVSEDEGKV